MFYSNLAFPNVPFLSMFCPTQFFYIRAYFVLFHVILHETFSCPKKLISCSLLLRVVPFCSFRFCSAPFHSVPSCSVPFYSALSRSFLFCLTRALRLWIRLILNKEYCRTNLVNEVVINCWITLQRHVWLVHPVWHTYVRSSNNTLELNNKNKQWRSSHVIRNWWRTV